MSMKKLTLVLFTIFLVSSSQLAYASLASILFTFTTHMWLAVFADWRNKSLPHFSTSHFLLSKRGHNSLEAIKEKNSESNKWMNVDKTVWAMEFYLITSVTAYIALYIIISIQTVIQTAHELQQQVLIIWHRTARGTAAVYMVIFRSCL